MEAKLNNPKAEIVKMGVLEIFYNGFWKKSDCIVTTLSLTCYENDSVFFFCHPFVILLIY